MLLFCCNACKTIVLVPEFCHNLCERIDFWPNLEYVSMNSCTSPQYYIIPNSNFTTSVTAVSLTVAPADTVVPAELHPLYKFFLTPMLSEFLVQFKRISLPISLNFLFLTGCFPHAVIGNHSSFSCYGEQ